jgi:predicted DsbA family dithiol-disulfide isomerase
VRVDIWSDVACPWCYIGKRRFEAALARFEHRNEVDVRWRSFELDPSAPAVREGAYADRLAAKYGVSVAEADATIDTMIEAGAQHGIVLRFDKARPGNTFDAHRLLHFAAERGVQHDLKERMLHATFTRGAQIADLDVLTALAADAGLDVAQARAVLDGDAFAADVRADERRAADLGITSVPYFVVADTFGVAGAQPPDLLLQVLEEGWSAKSRETTSSAESREATQSAESRPAPQSS